MENQKSIYDLELHESVILVHRGSQTSSFTQSATRVPGGWLYRSTASNTKDTTSTEAFVPYSDEFKPKKATSVKVSPQ